MRAPIRIVSRLGRGLSKSLVRSTAPLLLSHRSTNVPLERLGSDYGGWTVPPSLLGPDSICYCIGVGADATFDVALVERLGCHVFSFDPTPRSIEYMRTLEYDRSRLTFVPVAVWKEDTDLQFYAPRCPDHTSHSTIDLHGTGRSFLAPARSLRSLMSEYGHAQLDLIKLDIEGAWPVVIESMIEKNIIPKILCVEFDSPTSVRLVHRVVRRLRTCGLVLTHRELDNYLFLYRV